jgi:subfamily B ATP-binding cassette protein MsbA
MVIWAGWNIGNNLFFAASLSEGRQAAKSVFALLDSPDEDQIIRAGFPNAPNALSPATDTEDADLDTPNAEIEFRNVSFSYDAANRDVVKDVSFKIRVGERVALVGPSGCGKSTLVQLLLGFYPFAGAILVAGTDIRALRLQTHRRRFAVVSQEPSLFIDSVEANVRYNSAVSDEETRDATARIVLNSAPADLEASFLAWEVGSKGFSKISGGEKQRIACARAMLRRASVLVLDEATSALDLETEARIMGEMEKSYGARTVITVAHRLQTVERADRILVLDSGRLVESGSYAELMARPSYFRDFARGEKFVLGGKS